MSLTAAIHIARSALTASQIGIQVAGNNIANVATAGYSRQVGRFSPARGDGSQRGVMIGGGVEVRAVQRQIDTALQGRLWDSASNQAAAFAQSQVFSQIESTLGELGDNDLSSELSSFFKGWSEKANQTQSSTAVVQQGDKLAEFMRRLRSDLIDQRRQIDRQLSAGVERANQLLGQVADLNRAVSDAEVGGTTANTLRDQRDDAISELSTLMNVTVVDRGPEGMDVLAGSTPVVLAGQARGLELRRQTVNGEVQVSISTGPDGQQLEVSSGELGSLLASRAGAVDSTVAKLDTLASQLIFEINKLHSTGVNLAGLRSTTGTLRLPASGRGLALNDPTNSSLADLPFGATNGGFSINIRQQGTGTVQTVRIPVNLDGLTNAGTPGFGDDTSAEDIRAALDAIPGLTATFTPEGRLDLRADTGFDFSISDDSSGAPAVLGLNAYFTGTDAADIGIRADLKADASLLTTGRIVGGQFIENGTALAVAGLQELGITGLNGQSFADSWRESVQVVGADAATALSNAESTTVVRESLEAQRAAISGVSIDEESINLLDFQRQYQGAARVISIADELTRELMQLL